MAKYFLDTEFHEYKKKPLFGKPIDTIELISIGIVSEDFDKTLMPPCDVYANKVTTSREYYAICKDFDVKAAWDSFQLTEKVTVFDESHKVYWLRENVLKPIFKELVAKDHLYANQAMQRANVYIKVKDWKFNLKSFSKLLKKHGKSREVIAEEIHAFIYKEYLEGTGLSYPEAFGYSNPKYDPEFYAYYADYDWVVFCWIFGRMIDLPKGFPMYCKDLQQTKDEANELQRERCHYDPIRHRNHKVELLYGYPKQTNEHNALADAKWNKELYNFLNKL